MDTKHVILSTFSVGVLAQGAVTQIKTKLGGDVAGYALSGDGEVVIGIDFQSGFEREFSDSPKWRL